ncbi:MAG: DUF4258 domain-containing protein [Candidatus Cloacimonetes bacterium]|nr:DUF4258 domain-containing protein [Candidatus Cloacimonadota bacterium]
MNIRYSRHAKRRLKLYKITEKIISEILKEVNKLGRQEITKKVQGFKNPIKVVCDVKENYITIITAYPLKRGLK